MGAPQAAGLGQLRGTRPGALFRCPITPEEYDCERVDIDGEGEFVLLALICLTLSSIPDDIVAVLSTSE